MGIIKRDTIVEKNAEQALEPIIQKLKEAKSEFDELVKSSASFQKSLLSVKKTNDGTEAKKLVDINNKLIQNNLKLKEVKTANVRASEQLLKANAKLAQSQTKEAQQVALVNEKIRQQNKILKDNARATLGIRKRIGTFTKQLLGAAGLVGAATAVVKIFKNVLNIFKSFDKSASKLASILGKTKDQISALTQQAKDLGTVTQFTASQVLEAQTSLAKLGFTANQIQDAIPGVLSFAAATGTDLAQSADLAASTLRIFNLDASEMGRVSDVLAKSTTISSLSMEKLATIMPTVGKTAQLAGVSLERTAALAGTLTDRGLDASTAATSLRNIFLELSKKGLTWEQAMQKINTSTDKNKTAMDLFGKRAAAAGAILAETASDTDMLTNSLESAQGAAQEMADTMLDNLAGDITKAQSSWEGLILSLEDGEGRISKILRGLTQFFTGLLQALKNFNEESVKLDEFSKRKLGLTDEENKLLKEQKDQLTSITDKEKQRTKAIEIYQKRKKEISNLEKIALAASIDGDKQKAIAAQAEIDIRLKLLENVKQYIPELRKENKEIVTNNINASTSNNKRVKNSKAINKQAESLKKLNQQLQFEFAQIAEMEASDAQLAEILASDQQAAAYAAFTALGAYISANADANAAYEEDRVQAHVDANNEILKKDYELYQAGLDIRKAFEEEAVKFILNTANQLSEDKKNKELNRIEAEKDALKDQLDKGLINKIQYEAKLAELNKQARVADARAEKRAALYTIAIQTAVAVTKAIPNLIRMARAALLGGIQAVAVAARPLPNFFEGEEFVRRGKNPKGRDTIPAMLNEGERIVPTAINNMLHGVPNASLPTLVDSGLKKEYEFVRLLKSNEQMVDLLSNAYSSYTLGGKAYLDPWNGKGRIVKNG